MPKSAFTLVEVIVSILIVAVVGVGIMGSASNYTNLFSHIEKNSLNFEMLSLMGINANQKLHNSTKSLEDIALTEFFIKNDKVIDYLKSIEFSYKETKPAPIVSARETSEMEWQKDIKNTSQLQFGITKITIGGDQVSGIVFNIREITP